METRMNYIKQMFQCGECSWFMAIRLLDALSVSEYKAERFLRAE